MDTAIIHGAAEKVVGVKAMWFPSELLRLLSSGKGKRVQMRGPADVGKSVLSSIVVNPDSLPSNLQVENFVYASPYIAADMNVPEEQRQPFRFFANALQAIQSLRDWQPLDMHNTGPAEALMRAGFYSKIVDRERRALVLYDLLENTFRKGRVEMVSEQAANSDCIYILLDITCIPIFEEFIEPQNRKERAKKSQFNARLCASLRQIEGDETPKSSWVRRLTSLIFRNSMMRISLRIRRALNRRNPTLSNRDRLQQKPPAPEVDRVGMATVHSPASIKSSP